MTPALRVLAAGFLTTVQDLGRAGFGHLGVPRSGAADPFSARLANRLAGNGDEAAVLELTLSGPRLEALEDFSLALAGAEMVALRNGQPLAPERSHLIRRGEIIEFGSATSGLRTYIAFSGGIDVPEVLASRSTLLSSGFGGLEGRPLRNGDVLSLAGAGRPARREASAEAIRPPEGPLRVLPGPQADSFSPAVLEKFYRTAFRVSSESNRAGLRLEGERVPLSGEAEIAPEGVVTGAIQVPKGGAPIILMPDGPVTGSYPKLGAVISADWRRLGQLRPGESVKFERVAESDAANALREEEEKLDSVRETG
jgi:biotin-dependent carboxylase-like uncharacterized protein